MTDTSALPPRKEAVRTANGMYDYDKVSHGLTLHEWVQRLHEYNCTANGWNFVPLKRGAFGYDNLVMSVSSALPYEFDKNKTYYSEIPQKVLARFASKNNLNKGVQPTMSLEDVASDVHDGWSRNYRFWRDNKPWENLEYLYMKPYAPLGDERRNECAELPYIDLSDEECAKDDVIARVIIEILSARSEN